MYSLLRRRQFGVQHAAVGPWSVRYPYHRSKRTASKRFLFPLRQIQCRGVWQPGGPENVHDTNDMETPSAELARLRQRHGYDGELRHRGVGVADRDQVLLHTECLQGTSSCGCRFLRRMLHSLRRVVRLGVYSFFGSRPFVLAYLNEHARLPRWVDVHPGACSCRFLNGHSRWLSHRT